MTKAIASRSLIIQNCDERGHKMKAKVGNEINTKEGPPEGKEERIMSMWRILV